MATLEINGRDVEVDDSFLSLTPEQQEATVNEIAASLGQASGPPSGQPTMANKLDDYYSSGIYAGEYNPLGAIARSLDAATTAGGDVLTFSFGDELTGLVGGDTDIARQRQAALQESNPIASTVGGVATGLGMAGGSLRGAAQGSAGLMSALPSARMTGAALGPRVLVGAGEGAALGGLYGVGSGEGAWDRFKQGATGAAVGGVLGGAFPLVTQGIASGYRNVMDRRAQDAVARDSGVSPGVADVLTRTIDADGSLRTEGLQNMRAAGREAMLVDAGPNAQTILDTAIQKVGPGATLARQRVGERLTRDSRAVTQALDDTFGKPMGVAASQKAIRDASKEAVEEAYRLANIGPIDYSSEAGQAVESVINRIPDRIKGPAIQRANERIRYNEIANQHILADIAEDGAVTFREMPNVMQADAIKKSLREIVDAGTDAVTGKLSPDAQFAAQMERDLRNAMVSASDDYANALRTARDPLQRQSAIALGGKALGTDMKRDQFALLIDGFSDAEKKALGQGIRSQIDDTLANVKRTMANGDLEPKEAAKAIKELSSRANREKVSMVMGDEAAEKLFNEIDRAAKSFELAAATAQNSKTFARTAADEGVNALNAPGIVGTAARGEPINASKRAIQALTGQTDERLQALNDGNWRQIADFLTRGATEAIPAARALGDYRQQVGSNAMISAEIARLLSQGQRVVYPLTSTFVGD